jgi:hypothetical protein
VRGHNTIAAKDQLASRTHDSRSVANKRALPDSDSPPLCETLIPDRSSDVFVRVILVYDQNILRDDDITLQVNTIFGVNL